MKMISRIQLALLVLASFSFAQEDTRFFNVVDFGAKGDGRTLNTVALQRAVDKCAESGEVVFVPAH